MNPKLGCVTCRHVLNQEKPVRFISHSGGEWTLLCGDPKHYRRFKHDLTAGHIHHILATDRSLEEFSCIPINRAAERKLTSPIWSIIVDIDEEWVPEAEDIVGVSEKQLDLFVSNYMNGIHFLKNSASAYACVNFETGLNAIPIWPTFGDAALVGQRRWPDDFVTQEPFDKFFHNLAVRMGQNQWVAIDFLVGSYFAVATVAEVLAARARYIEFGRN